MLTSDITATTRLLKLNRRDKVKSYLAAIGKYHAVTHV